MKTATHIHDDEDDDPSWIEKLIDLEKILIELLGDRPMVVGQAMIFAIDIEDDVGEA